MAKGYDPRKSWGGERELLRREAHEQSRLTRSIVRRLAEMPNSEEYRALNPMVAGVQASPVRYHKKAAQ